MLRLKLKHRAVILGTLIQGLLLSSILLIVGLCLILWPQTVNGQNGPYRLTIEGQVMRDGGVPGMLKPVVLTTPLGESLETKTDGDGYFILTGSVMADSGLLEVRSGAVSDISFGEMTVTWAAGGPGDKYLTVDLITDGNNVWSDASEPPYPNPLPGETIVEGGAEPLVPPPVTPVPLATTVPSTPMVEPAPTQALSEPVSAGTNWLVVMMVTLGLLVALVLLGGGVVLLLQRRMR